MREYVNDAILNAISFIEENLTSSINVKDMADAAGYSVFHFSRTFNKVTGHSPYDYLLRRKLSEAAFDVLEDKTSLTDIAFKYQFSNYETFTRGFQRLFGATPSEFREERKVHMLQWKRRFSMDYLSHLNSHNYTKPEKLHLEEAFVGGHIISDRHLYDDNGKPLVSPPEGASYVHLHREHRHLHEYAFMKGNGVFGKLVPNLNAVEEDWVLKPIQEGAFIKFEYSGSYFQIQNVYTYIFETWMPQAGFSVDVPYVFEKIFKEENKTEIYIPVLE